MRETLIRTSALAAVVAGCLVAAPVGAQQEAPQPGAQQEAVTPGTFSESQIDAFAAAVRDVTQIQQEYGTRIEAADSPEEADNLREEAVEAMVDAVEEQGLTPEEYNSMLEAAQADPALYAMIVERMQADQ